MYFLNLDPDSDLAKSLMLDMFVRQGKEADALRQISLYRPKWGGFDLLTAKLDGKSAVEIHALATAMNPDEDPETTYFAAGHLAYVGEIEQALVFLRAAIKGNYCSYPAMDTDPFFSSLRTSSEFSEIRSAAMKCRSDFLANRER